MNRLRLTLVGVAAALALVGAQAAQATTVQKFSLQELSKKAAGIVTAQVEDAYSSWDAAHKEIYTFYTLRVLQPVKGMKGENTVTLRQLGGTVDNIASIVPGMPSFRKGEEVVVFLTKKDGAGYPWVMGLQQGKYTIVTDSNGAKKVRNDLAGTELVDQNGQKVPTSISADLPLGAFLDGIKTTIGEGGPTEIESARPTETPTK